MDASVAFFIFVPSKHAFIIIQQVVASSCWRGKVKIDSNKQTDKNTINGKAFLQTAISAICSFDGGGGKSFHSLFSLCLSSSSQRIDFAVKAENLIPSVPSSYSECLIPITHTGNGERALCQPEKMKSGMYGWDRLTLAGTRSGKYLVGFIASLILHAFTEVFFGG